ncbi:MAG: hypothetical protein AB1650_07825 [Candidatus Omnitrophota bacterium]
MVDKFDTTIEELRLKNHKYRREAILAAPINFLIYCFSRQCKHSKGHRQYVEKKAARARRLGSARLAWILAVPCFILAFLSLKPTRGNSNENF